MIMNASSLNLKHIIFFIIFSIFPFLLYAQKIEWKDYSNKVFVYQINNKEAVKLLRSKKPDNLMEKMLHTFVGSFTREELKNKSNELNQGHFIHVSIYKNKEHYSYVPIIPFQVFLFKEYGILNLQVVDAEGNIRDNAKVNIKGKWSLFDSGISYDEESKTYRVNDWSENTDRILTVKLDDFEAVFDLKKHLVPSWMRGSGGFYDNKPDFYSYMITDKNKYKPGETVRFKSYALSGGKRPLKKELELWLRDNNYKYKKIKNVSPYNPGGFAGEVELHDSLNLKLDKYYPILLQDDKGRVVARTTFRYEDYELYDNALEVKVGKQIHFYPDSNNVEIKVTDANGLLLQDMKADILIRRGDIKQTYQDIFTLSDTLLYKRITLNNNSSTFFSIPPAIFGEADGSYRLSVEALSHDNQKMTYTTNILFFRSHYDIDYALNDTIISFDFHELGKEKNIKAKLSYNNSDDSEDIELPYSIEFNQKVKSYKFKASDPDFEKVIFTHNINPRLQIEGGFAKDSFNVSLINPLKLDVSWYIYKGNYMLTKGFGKELDFKSYDVEFNTTYYVEIFYFMGDEEKILKEVFTPKAEHLNVDIDLPDRIYPGQKLDAKVTVKDFRERPVKGVDLTAFAVNALLKYNVPDLPYYGQTPEGREKRDSYSIKEKDFVSSKRLDWNYWKRRAGLEDMEYYRFTYPWDSLFKYTINTPNQTTQFAPYVMNNGEGVNIYVIECNNFPMWFSWADHLKSYSVQVSDTVNYKISLRLSDRILIIDSVMFEKGKKTILSLDINHLPKGIRVIFPKLKDKYNRDLFSDNEHSTYNRYLSRIPIDSRSSDIYLRKGDQKYLVYNRCLQGNKKSILIGPLQNGRYRYEKTDYISPEYKHEGGYAYDYEESVVYKQPVNLLPEYLDQKYTLDFSNINDFCFTSSILKEKISECVMGANRWHPRNIYLVQSTKTMNFKLPVEDERSGVSNLLFRDTETDKILFPDRLVNNKRGYHQLPQSTYDVILLYNNGTYLKYNEILLKDNTYTELNMAVLPLNEKDSLSTEWLKLQANGAYQIGDYVPPSRSSTLYSRNVGSKAANVVSGYIVDINGEEIIGATVVIKGTSYGTISNLDGYFEIDIAGAGDVLEVSYLGMKSTEVNINSGSHLMITMEEDEQSLDEVVVVGYGNMKKSNLTGSVSSILSGRIAGVSTINESSFSPEDKVKDNTVEDQTEKQAAEDKLYSELMMLNGLRSNFSDVGFWQPALFTDKEGEAKFEVIFPDNITQWETIVYAMNRKLKTGTLRKSIKSYKPLMAELKAPQFLVVGDSSDFSGNIRNYTKDKEIEGKIMFTLEQDTLMNKDIRFASSYQNKLLVTANNTDSISTTYLFTRNDGYSDGEKRSISIEQQGVEVAKGSLEFLRNGRTVLVDAKEGEEVNVSITGNQLDIYMDATRYLTRYKYDCNEQLASKLIGLLRYKDYKKLVGERFTYDKNVNQIIKRLVANRNENKLWAWWGQSSNTSYWMSAHIINALKMAKDAGYTVNLDISNMKYDYMDIQSLRKSSLNDIEILHALSNWGVTQNYKDAISMFENEISKQEYIIDSIAKAEKKIKDTSFLKEKLLLWELRQKYNIEYSSDSISRYLKKDVLGAVYCDDGISRRWYSNNLSTTLIAYRIVRNDSTLHHLVEPMQMYILGTKDKGWNTYQASQAVSVIMPDLIFADTYSKKAPSTVLLSGKENKKITSFPFEMKLKQGEQLQIEKKDGVPLIYSAYTIKRVTEANAGDAFEVSSILGSGSEIVTSRPVTLSVNLEVKQDNAEYVMIEIPIPAGCSYYSKKNGYNYRNREVHREHFKEKTVIFCESLPKGTYQYDIELLPRYTGTYTLNPVKVELMYFPVINANNNIRKILIDE